MTRDLTLRNEFEAFVRKWGPSEGAMKYVNGVATPCINDFIADIERLLTVQRERCAAAMLTGDKRDRRREAILAKTILDVTP